MKRKFVSLYHPSLLYLFDKNEQRALALFFKAKKAYKNSCYYNWSYSSLAKKLNLSIYIIKKYIPILIEKGFVYEHGDNLIFKSTYKIVNKDNDGFSKKGWYELKIKFKDSLGTILEEIYLAQIKQEISHQEYHIRNKADYQLAQSENGYISKGKIKHVKKYVKEFGKPGKVLKDVVLGSRKISQICNISLGKTNSVINNLEKSKKIKTKVLYNIIDRNVNGKYLDAIRDAYKNEIGYLFVRNGALISIIGTSIIIL